jgi:hypothetical protein
MLSRNVATHFQKKNELLYLDEDNELLLLKNLFDLVAWDNIRLYYYLLSIF